MKWVLVLIVMNSQGKVTDEAVTGVMFKTQERCQTVLAQVSPDSLMPSYKPEFIDGYATILRCREIREVKTINQQAF